MRYRTALIGIVFGVSLLIGFGAMLGLNLLLGLVFFFLYFAVAVSITRMRAEMGTPVHDLDYTGPDQTISDILGPNSLGMHNMTGLSVLFWFNRVYRCHPMPVQLEGMKMAEQSGARKEMRTWIGALMLAGVVGMISMFWAILHFNYIGVGHGFDGHEAWDRELNWIAVPKPGHGAVGISVLVGFVFSAILQVLRLSSCASPFHPLAYAVSGTWQMNLMWLPLFIAWVAKTLLLRYGGPKKFTEALPFCYGLILGQFIPGSLLNIWGLITNNSTYQFWQ